MSPEIRYPSSRRVDVEVDDGPVIPSKVLAEIMASPPLDQDSFELVNAHVLATGRVVFSLWRLGGEQPTV